ncbi:ParB N-terminal domain-containing protein [Paenibacillus sp. R14(2021)]|uniref:ParB/RepB/Spo0J family partition protein n=1 Tax=Paenibacillus sp. R14(2021) TaxID=2859228 RepID=UPI001C61267F|nr:ParB N-terminal domain-containing protein [Paenibacillus sp. R14(2021)]
MKIYEQIQEIPINTLTEHSLNTEYHSELSSSEYDLLYQDIKTNGLQHPLLINKDNVILSGHARWKICRDLNYENINVKLIECSTDEELELLVLANKTRRGSERDHIKIAKQIKLLYECWKVSPGRKSVHDAQDNDLKNRHDVALAFDKSDSQIRRYLQLLNLKQNLQNLVSEEKITLMGGVELSGLSTDSQDKFYECLQNMGFPKLTVQQIKKIIGSITVAEETKNRDNTTVTDSDVINIEEKEIKKVHKAVLTILQLKLSTTSIDQLKAIFIHAINNLEGNV